LVLDEATSALDNVTEQAVMEAVHNLSHEITIVIIAHRLSTVRECDQIFLIEKGALAADGTYEQLRASSKEFNRMLMADITQQNGSNNGSRQTVLSLPAV